MKISGSKTPPMPPAIEGQPAAKGTALTAQQLSMLQGRRAPDTEVTYNGDPNSKPGQGLHTSDSFDSGVKPSGPKLG